MTGDCHAGILWEPGGEIPPGDPTSTQRMSPVSQIAICEALGAVDASMLATVAPKHLLSLSDGTRDRVRCHQPAALLRFSEGSLGASRPGPAPRQPGVWALGRPGGSRPRPGRAPIYRFIWRPALAEIVGDGRPWTVPMISLLSMPCR